MGVYETYLTLNETGSLIKELTFSQDSFVRKMALLKNGMLACGGYDGSLKICDPTTGIIVNELKGHESSIVSLRTLSDGSIVSYSNNGKIKIWNSQNGELEANASADFIETLDEDNAGELAVLSDCWDARPSQYTINNKRELIV